MVKQEIIYIVATDVEQDLIDEMGFGQWLVFRREQLCEEFKTDKVTIAVMGKAVYVISKKVESAEIDRLGLTEWCRRARHELMDRFDTMRAFVVAV